jgi:hypothetical protein
MGGNSLTGLAAGTGTGQSLRFEQLFSQGTEADLASAATTDIGLQNTNFLRVTGTTTITSFGTNYNGPRFLRFAGVLTLTNSATLILPGAANITTVAGDTLIAIPKATAGTADGWQVVAYQRASGLALVSPATSGTATVPLTNVNVTLTTAQAAFPVITFTGTLTGNVNVIFPNDVKSYRILNNTSGAFTITCKTAAGTGVVVAAGSSDIFCDGTNISLDQITSKYLLDRLDNTATIFTKTANATASVKAYTSVYARNALISVSATAQAVVMPTLNIGTDYAIYACDDLTFRADSSFTAPTGYTTANSRRIGGFHYSPGGHSGSAGGGNTTPQINEYSFWDLKFKPAAKDPRGMTLVAGAFWRDIYLLGVDHQTNGTSKYAVTIADGSSPPKVPALFGGNGSTTYPGLDWFAASEIMKSHGKRLMTYDELSASAYGTTEASSIGTDQVTTQWNAAYVSKWGANQVSGVMYVRSSEFGGGAAGAAWTANTGGRGSTYQMENAMIFGGNWGDGSLSGSRCSAWHNSPTVSGSHIGVAGACDHLVLE